MDVWGAASEKERAEMTRLGFTPDMLSLALASNTSVTRAVSSLLDYSWTAVDAKETFGTKQSHADQVKTMRNSLAQFQRKHHTRERLQKKLQERQAVFTMKKSSV